jgi:hypothetical protein
MENLLDMAAPAKAKVGNNQTTGTLACTSFAKPGRAPDQDSVGSQPPLFNGKFLLEM